MTAAGPAPAAGASQQAAVDAALLLLDRMGLSPADLLAAPGAQPTMPTFAEYLPVVSDTVTPGTRRAYGSYWNRSFQVSRAVVQNTCRRLCQVHVPRPSPPRHPAAR